MKIEQVKRNRELSLKGKGVSISIRVTQEVSDFLRSNEVSPTALFNEATKEIGYKEQTKEKKA